MWREFGNHDKSEKQGTYSKCYSANGDHGIALGGSSDFISVFGGAGHCTWSKEEKLSLEVTENGGLCGTTKVQPAVPQNVRSSEVSVGADWMKYIPAGHQREEGLWSKGGLCGFTQGGDGESLCNLAVEVCSVGKQHAREIAELRNWTQVILTREIDEGQREEAQFVGVKEEGAGNKVWMLVKPGAQELPQQALTAVGAFFLLCGKMRGELPQEVLCGSEGKEPTPQEREREKGESTPEESGGSASTSQRRRAGELAQRWRSRLGAPRRARCWKQTSPREGAST